MRTNDENRLELADVFAPVTNALQRLVQKARQGLVHVDELDQMDGLLQTLPLSSDAFGIATNHLQNARKYFESAEQGAALWELSALTNQIRNHAIAKTFAPRRRRRHIKE